MRAKEEEQETRANDPKVVSEIGLRLELSSTSQVHNNFEENFQINYEYLYGCNLSSFWQQNKTEQKATFGKVPFQVLIPYNRS